MNNIFDKSGVIPFCKVNGELWVLLVTPTNPKFGGSNPQVCKGIIEDKYDIYFDGRITAMRELQEETGIILKDDDEMVYYGHYNLQKKILKGLYMDYRLHIYYFEMKEKILHPLSETDGEVIANWYRIPTALKTIRRDQKHILIDFISGPISL